ncbi:MAG TPA: type II CAAX endopeptidase family protein [Gemmatimonadales bacterium]|nr:type II CAAX endopeptidase family protein [Gemmatimonadales bacterium]
MTPPISPETNSRPVLRAIAGTTGYLGLGTALALVVGALYFVLIPGGASRAAPDATNAMGAEDALVQSGAMLVGFGIATWLIGFKLLRLTREDLRWFRASPGLRWFGWGLLIGAAPALLTVGVAMATTDAGLVSDQGSVTDYLRAVGLTGLVLLPAAASEELAFRGVPLVALAQAIGRVPATICTAILFGLIHAFNPHQTPLGLLNAAVAGVLLAVAFFTPGGIWTAVGAHLGWNMTLAAFDAPVSGLIFPIPWLNYRAGHPDWLTGGAFGPEGGVLATGALAIAIAVATRWTVKESAA